MRLICRAIEHGQRLYREDLHHHEKGVALLTAMYVNSKRDKKKKAAQPNDYYYFPLDNQANIPGLACDAFFALVEEEIMPDWALGLAPIDTLRRDRAHGEPPRQRALVGTDIMLVLPELHGGKIRADFALLDGVEEEVVTLNDIDTDEEFCITIPPELRGQRSWVLDFNTTLED